MATDQTTERKLLAHSDSRVGYDHVEVPGTKQSVGITYWGKDIYIKESTRCPAPVEEVGPAAAAVRGLGQGLKELVVGKRREAAVHGWRQLLRELAESAYHRVTLTLHPVTRGSVDAFLQAVHDEAEALQGHFRHIYVHDVASLPGDEVLSGLLMKTRDIWLVADICPVTGANVLVKATQAIIDIGFSSSLNKGEKPISSLHLPITAADELTRLQAVPGWENGHLSKLTLHERPYIYTGATSFINLKKFISNPTQRKIGQISIFKERSMVHDMFLTSLPDTLSSIMHVTNSLYICFLKVHASSVMTFARQLHHKFTVKRVSDREAILIYEEAGSAGTLQHQMVLEMSFPTILFDEESEKQEIQSVSAKIGLFGRADGIQVTKVALGPHGTGKEDRAPGKQDKKWDKAKSTLDWQEGHLSSGSSLYTSPSEAEACSKGKEEGAASINPISKLPQITYCGKISHPLKVSLHEKLTLQVLAEGDEPPVVTWYHEREKLVPSATVNISTSEGLSTLSIPHCQQQHHGQYSIMAENTAGFFKTFFYICLRDGDIIPVKQPDVFAAKVVHESETVILQHPKSNITLTVPKGAVPANTKALIEGRIHTYLKDFSSLLSEGESFIAPIIEYTSNVKYFNNLLSIKIPHPVVLKEGETDTFKVYCQDKQGHIGVLGRNTKDGSFYEVHEDFVNIKTTHFTVYACMIHNDNCTIRSLLQVYMSVDERGRERVVTLCPQLILKCKKGMDHKEHVVVSPGMTMKKEIELLVTDISQCLSIRRDITAEENWKFLHTFVYHETAPYNVINLEDIVSQMEVPMVIPFHEILLKSEERSLSCLLKLIFCYPDGVQKEEPLRFDEIFPIPGGGFAQPIDRDEGAEEGAVVALGPLSRYKGHDLFMHTDFARILRERRPVLQHLVRVTPLMSSLQRHRVVSELDKQDIEEPVQDYLRAEKLFDHLHRGDLARFIGFLRALKDQGNQDHVIRELSINPADLP